MVNLNGEVWISTETDQKGNVTFRINRDFFWRGRLHQHKFQTMENGGPVPMFLILGWLKVETLTLSEKGIQLRLCKDAGR